MFAVGGGGAASGSYAGSSGYFKQKTIDITQTQTLVIDITIGLGGSTSGANGQATTVQSTLFTVSAQGGGQGTGTGWSGGTGGGTGGYNGQYGSGEQLPTLCQATLTPGAAGYGGNHGGGGGGVIVNGQKPARLFVDDGEGYGAGGGEDHRNGYAGVVVLTVCGPGIRNLQQ